MLGLLAAFCSGLLGIGGGLIVIPLLLYVPPAFGLPAFDIKTASAIAVAQVATAAGSGTLANLRRGTVHWRLAGFITSALMAGAFLGGLASRQVPEAALLTLVAALSSIAAGVMLLPTARGDTSSDRPAFNPILATACGLAVGGIIGLSGSGAFILIPIQVYLLRMPTRTAIATGLASGFPSAAAALLGKALTGQVQLLPALVVCLLAIPGAQLGTAVAARLSIRVLRRLYALIVLLVAASLWFDVLHTP
jgi:uncharacterized membrane protein YfcA